MDTLSRIAPAWQIDSWLNTPTPLSLEALRGRVIVLEAFQMLCPGCVAHALPQAQRVQQTFAADPVTVVGVHTVFEHHAAMTATALQAFLHEYRIGFPVGIATPGLRDAIPPMMRAYRMRGTPTLTLIDARGRIRWQHFGAVSELMLGAQIAALVSEAKASTRVRDSDEAAGSNDCEVACELPAEAA